MLTPEKLTPYVNDVLYPWIIAAVQNITLSCMWLGHYELDMHNQLVFYVASPFLALYIYIYI